jgi:hypothetical protein
MGSECHSTEVLPVFLWTIPDPASGAQHAFAPARQRRRIRKIPSSAGPGRTRFTRVLPWRIAKSAPLEVTCAARPDADAILVEAKRADVQSVRDAGRGTAARGALVGAEGTGGRLPRVHEGRVHGTAG